MTWFAEEILAAARPGVIEEFGSFSPYREATYLIREIGEQKWWPENVRHGVPPEGLVVVRPVGKPGAHDRWFGKPVIPWLPPPARGAIASEIAPADVVLTEVSHDVLPPADFLAYLKHVAATHRAPVAYGFFSTWGGANEIEYAWIFADRSELLLVNETEDARCTRIEPGGHTTDIDRPLLDILAEALGFRLSGGCFAPHMREFDWERHRWGKRPAPSER